MNRIKEVNIKDTIIFSLAIAILIIALHQSITVGFNHSYWIFMLALGLLFWLKLRINKKESTKNNTINKHKPGANKNLKK